MATQYTQKLSSGSIMEQPDNHTLTVDSPATFAASGAGSTTTIVSTALGGVTDSDDDKVGRVVECLSATNSENVGRRARITATTDATNTFTIDALPSATASGDTFALYLPSHPFFVEDTGGASDTDIVDDNNRDEADDYYNGTATEGGPYIEVIASDNIATSEHPLVSDWTSSTGTLVAGTAFSGNTAEGDCFETWRHPEWFSLSVETGMEDIDRAVMTGDLYSEGPIKGNRTASASGELAFRGPGAGTYSELYPLLRCLFDADGGEDLTAHTAISTSSIVYDAGTAEADSLYLTENGDVFANLSDVATPIVPYPHLRSAPAVDSTIERMITFSPSSDVNLSLALKHYRGNGLLEYLWGWLPKVTFSGAKGEVLKCSVSGDALDFMTLGSSAAIERGWSPVRPSVAPKKLGAIRVNIGNTAYNARSFSFDPAPEISKTVNICNPNHVDGWQVTGWNATGSIEVYVDSTNRVAISDFIAGREKGILIQAGLQSGDPGVWAMYAPECQYTGITFGEDSGGITMTLPFHVNRVSSTSYSPFVIGIV